ncbi:MAG: 3'(2'),5'-bisphosphate nucleotidase CysQ [Gammaproteobacteria bacterium]|jgi:3'(2'), 5'-bisphosphate nucleotidase|nr:3'(2'),5'-bisphosphate nucleotidase CysQ [Gammaproteobacteria bacterium]MBT3858574.1 3'(2'),5'-bisphosphate nucleotidase CysQ [Gammaproteobacteria bacterium]MBT3986688.1 3'(2'),5'-bisphosphate nucleotidase CysQ [Gammaproteobacteria bacterium]MBT4257024.1 3'(2'),5'-bisphosphate nucleotidase CysQ [Gammaproteobacteria bacterium]MBT4582784.1 3'(2'),5'-bisphosphate nucleotidase CysQ [Gammaproteobacteria bacterium]
MGDIALNDEQLESLLDIAAAAGREILTVYNQSEAIEVEKKADDSPITLADRNAHKLIEARLQEWTPEIPVFSEESDTIEPSVRKSWDKYWLVDPLDGTKEFVKRNGEFTVNIALIENGVATAGVVHVPVSGITYLGRVGLAAYKIEKARCTKISVSNLDQNAAVRIVASRSHKGESLEKLIRHIEHKLGEVEVVSMGSSLKMCLIAEGKADIYPRLAPTSEWDTAAAHAVVSAAGGRIVDTGFKDLRYNQKELLLNPNFIALGDSAYPWQSLLSASLPD